MTPITFTKDEVRALLWAIEAATGPSGWAPLADDGDIRDIALAVHERLQGVWAEILESEP